MSDFVHIHNHSQYSKFDGFASVEDIVKKAKSLNMRAVGLTDHGTFAGAIDFIKNCRSQKIKPIVGMETYLARNHKVSNKDGQPDGRKGNRHLNLIAKNYKGLQNICSLSQHASLEGYYYDPRVDFELLASRSEGVIATSACLSSVINWNLSIDRYEHAKRAASLFKDIYKDDFYLEVMYHGIDKEGQVLPLIQKLGKELGIKIIATNDCHYIERKDAEFHEYLMCMSSGRCVKDPKRIKFPYDEFFFKSEAEMRMIFGHVEEYMQNTIDIAEKCDYSDLIFVEEGGDMKLPKFELPQGFSSPHDYLEKIAWEGLKKIGLNSSEIHKSRLQQELSDIRLIWDTKRYDFATYFLLVEDIMRFAKENDIAAGIRGSGYGSVLLKCLSISEGVDPIAQDLLWERFLGFDDARFLSEDDFGIKQISAEEKLENAEKDATEVMFDRYV